MHRLALRVSLPDRPGALSGITAALGTAGADIVSLHVVARDRGMAVDDLCLESHVGPLSLRAALECLPGVVVEAIRGVDEFRDAGHAVSLAARLADRMAAVAPASPSADGVLGVLLDGLPAALWATWCAAVQLTPDRGLRVLGTAHGVPDLDGGRAPWLPLDAPRTIEVGPWLPTEQQEPARRCGLEVAVAPLGDARTAVLLARVGGPQFRAAELDVLADLARIAALGLPPATEGLTDLRVSARAGRAATAGRS